MTQLTRERRKGGARKRAALAGMALALGAALLLGAGESRHINVIELDNQIVSPVTADYIESAIARSEDENAVCLVIQLDTPGGLMESTRGIVKQIMNARVPVVVYVAPSGSRAGSAGVFITYAAHVAAMAPSTNIGAAHPVDLGGGDNPIKRIIKQAEGQGDAEGADDAPKPGARDARTTAPREGAGATQTVEEERSPMDDKILNDTVAWITTIAHTRGRNEEWAKKAVTESVSITEDEALQERVIDLVAVDLPDLLKQLDGRTVKVKGEDVALATAGATVVSIPMRRFQKFLVTITHPNIAYLLMMLGTLGLIFEFTHPGIGFPGIAGLVCLLLALYSFQVLPVNYAAVILLALGLGLFVAEIKVMSHGLLALGGAICLTLGSVMLFQSPDPALRVSLSVVLPTVLTLGAIVLFVVHRALTSSRLPVATGAPGLVGQIGEAATDLNPQGSVFVHGELWRAASDAPVSRGGRVRVTDVSGLSLRVRPE